MPGKMTLSKAEAALAKAEAERLDLERERLRLEQQRDAVEEGCRLSGKPVSASPDWHKCNARHIEIEGQLAELSRSIPRLEETVERFRRQTREEEFDRRLRKLGERVSAYESGLKGLSERLKPVCLCLRDLAAAKATIIAEREMLLQESRELRRGEVIPSVGDVHPITMVRQLTLRVWNEAYQTDEEEAVRESLARVRYA